MIDIEKNAADAKVDDFAWHAMTKEEDAGSALLGLDDADDIRSKGLSSAPAKKRLEDYGPNHLSEKQQKTLLQRIWAQLYIVFGLCRHCLVHQRNYFR
jgi:magnesium-transporting ATPase (P-type)